MQQRQKHSKTSYSWRVLCIRLIFPKPLFKIWYPIFWVCVQWFSNLLWIELINFLVIYGDWYPIVFWFVFNNHQISSKICHNSWSIRRYRIITFLYANKFQSLFSRWEIFEQFLHIALRTNITNQNWYNRRWGRVLFYVIFFDIFDRILDFFRDNNAHFYFFVDILL